MRGQDWRERVAGWVVPTGCDALVVQREVLDPAEYVELWLRDSGDDRGEDYPARYDAWLDWFDRRDVEAVGLGWVTMRRRWGGPPVRADRGLPAPGRPAGGRRALASWFERHDRVHALDDDALLGLAPVLAADVHVEQESVAAPGGGLERRPARVRQAGGLRRDGEIDPVGVAVLAGADGRRPLGLILAGSPGPTTWSRTSVEPAAVVAVRSLLRGGVPAAALTREPGDRV